MIVKEESIFVGKKGKDIFFEMKFFRKTFAIFSSKIRYRLLSGDCLYKKKILPVFQISGELWPPSCFNANDMNKFLSLLCN